VVVLAVLDGDDARPAGLEGEALRVAVPERVRGRPRRRAREDRFHAELSIPDAAGTLELVADLRSRLVTASTRLDAPREGRARGRVSWLLRQLQAAPDDLRIEAKVAYADATLTAALAEARANPDMLYPSSDRDILHFVLSLTRNAGLSRDAGRGSFSDSVVAVAKDMYSSVLQDLRG